MVMELMHRTDFKRFKWFVNEEKNYMMLVHNLCIVNVMHIKKNIHIYKNLIRCNYTSIFI